MNSGFHTPLIITRAVAFAALALAPSIARAQPCEAEWSDRWPGGDLNNAVFALAAFNLGDGAAVYAGGSFTSAGGVPANHIAKWNGTAWSAMGPGLNGPVVSHTVYNDGTGNALYAGGFFSGSGAQGGISFIAKWNGTAWVPVGTGVNGAVHALSTFDDGSGTALYAGGEFTTAGGQPANFIAKWNGVSWSAVGTGTNDRVVALRPFNDGSGLQLYAGGDFNQAGGTAAPFLARWNGAAWSGVGGGTNNRVSALTAYNDGTGSALYIGGFFTTAGGTTVNRVAKWNGAAWSALGDGMSSSLPGSAVYSLKVLDDGGGPALFAGGDFTQADGVDANGVARWRNGSWSALADGVNPVFAMTPFNPGTGNRLVVGGAFLNEKSPSRSPMNVAIWDGSRWVGLGRGADDTLRVMEVLDAGDGPALYAGGLFRRIGGVVANGVAVWNGSAWSALGSGTDGSVAAFAVFDDGDGPALYAGGDFETIGGVDAPGLAKWNGSVWSAVGGGVTGEVRALAVFDGGGGPALYAGGALTEAGGVPVSGIARWDGSEWSDVGGGFGGSDAAADALAVFNEGRGTGQALYAGGRFITAGGVTVNSIARWDGSGWSAVGGGLSHPVFPRAHEVFADGRDGLLYVGGSFTLAGGVAVRNIAAWDGMNWRSIGTGIGGGGSPTVLTVAAFDDIDGHSVYAGGRFEEAGGVASGRLARWDGSSWSAVGANGSVRTLAVDGGAHRLYAGGAFSAVAGVLSERIAELTGCAPLCPADWDGSGEVDSNDYFDFLASFFANDADVNGDGQTTSDDYFAFLKAFFAECP